MYLQLRKFNPFKYIKFLFLILLPVFIVSTSLISSTQGVVRYSEENLKKLFNSSTRYIVELSGNWDRSTDGNEWTTVSLPLTDANKEKVIYKKNLSIDPNMVKKYSWSLNFFGLSDQVEIYLNNQLLGKYFGAMTPFSVNIPQNLISGRQNVLQLVVTPADKFSELIKDKNLYFKYNSIGIPREIFLVGTPQIWIKDINYRTSVSDDLSSANISAKVTIASGQLAGLNLLNNDSLLNHFTGKTTVNVSAEIFSAATNSAVATSASQELSFENERSSNINFNFSINNPELWSPDTPNLYYIKVKISHNGSDIDEYSQNIGIRSVKTNVKQGYSGSLLVNGKPFVIKGIDYIEDHYNTGASLTPYRMEQDVILMKTLGANLIRFKYAVPHPYLAYLCDKYGMFFTVDVPLYNVPSDFFSIYEIKSRMKNLVERITSDYNAHPATFGYSLGEGLIENQPVEAAYSDLINLFKSSTDKLLIKSILLGTSKFATDKIDLINVIDNRKYIEYGLLDKKIKNIIERADGKPVIINFGFPIQINNSNGYSDPLSLEAQRNYILHNVNLVNNNKLAGLIYWAFNDYRINNPLMAVNNDEQDVVTVGLFNRARQQRLSYSTLQAFYTGQEEQPLLTAGSYSETIPLVYIIGGLLLITIIFAFTQRFKRFREYLMRSVLRPYNFYADIRDQRIISIGQTLLLAFIISLSVGLYHSAILYFLRTSDIAQMHFMSVIMVDSLLPGLFRLIWQPLYMSLIIAAVYFLIIFILAGVIRLLSLFVKSRIYYTDTLTIAVWASVPLLIMLPVSIFISKLLSAFPYLTLTVLVITLLFYIWVIFRMIKASTVVFDIRPSKAYLIGAGILLLVIIAKVWILNTTNSLFSYVSYLYQYIMNS